MAWLINLSVVTSTPYNEITAIIKLPVSTVYLTNAVEILNGSRGEVAEGALWHRIVVTGWGKGYTSPSTQAHTISPLTIAFRNKLQKVILCFIGAILM